MSPAACRSGGCGYPGEDPHQRGHPDWAVQWVHAETGDEKWHLQHISVTGATLSQRYCQERNTKTDISVTPAATFEQLEASELACLCVRCRDQDNGGVPSYGEARKEIQTSGEFPGGGDGWGLPLHHSALHWDAAFQPAGLCQLSGCSSLSAGRLNVTLLSFSGYATSWRRRRRLRGSFMKIRTQMSASSSSQISSGTRNRRETTNSNK